MGINEADFEILKINHDNIKRDYGVDIVTRKYKPLPSIDNNDGFVKIVNAQGGDGWVDVFIYKLNDDKFETQGYASTLWDGHDDHFYVQEIDNMKTGKFGDITINVPDNSIRYLTSTYGQDWETPKITGFHTISGMRCSNWYKLTRTILIMFIIVYAIRSLSYLSP